ncbi:MAG TPA: hypothetical protein ENI05_03475 [Porticoccus sp.]|nr:hypothetical protein [Porticoccus sp.]
MSVGNNEAVDPSQCPLCGQSNNCEVSDGANCWCRSETFTEALLNLSGEPIRKSCICLSCVRERTPLGSDAS